MHIKRAFAITVMVITPLTVSSGAAGETAQCSARITRASIVPCALAASLAVRAERQELDAASARRVAVSPLLPANPVVALSVGRRTTGSLEATNWYATLGQEIEVAGQRGVRRDAAQAAVDAQSKRVTLSRRETAALAWVAFFEAVAARDEQGLAVRLTAATQAVSVVAHARAEKGLIAPVDADVAEATAIRVLQLRLAADRRVAEGQALVASLMGLDPRKESIAVDGELTPVAGVEEALARQELPLSERPEVQALDAERRAQELRADALRRARIPNPTVSLFVQNDGFNERVFGAGVSLPIPLPGNVGRTYRGEIAEAEALSLRVATDREAVQRRLRLEVTTSAQAFQSRTQEVQAFSQERVARAEASLISLGQEVEAGRLGVRDAVVAQQALIELLRASVEARKAWCLASVDLARALGIALEGRSL